MKIKNIKLSENWNILWLILSMFLIPASMFIVGYITGLDKGMAIPDYKQQLIIGELQHQVKLGDQIWFSEREKFNNLIYRFDEVLGGSDYMCSNCIGVDNDCVEHICNNIIEEADRYNKW